MAKSKYTVQISTIHGVVGCEVVSALGVHNAVEYAMYNLYMEGSKVIEVNEQNDYVYALVDIG